MQCHVVCCKLTGSASIPMLQVSDPSLLRFLVDMRGANPDDKQLRDDLMTMLIAGGRRKQQQLAIPLSIACDTK